MPVQRLKQAAAQVVVLTSMLIVSSMCMVAGDTIAV